MTTPTTKAAELPEALPRYREYMHLRTTGAWSDGVPAWAKDYSGLMNDMTAAHAVIEELYAQVEALSAAQAGAPAPQPSPSPAPAVRWNDAAILSLLNRFGDGPYGEEDVLTMRRALVHYEEIRRDLEAASPAPAQPGQEGEREAFIRWYMEYLHTDEMLAAYVWDNEHIVPQTWRAARAQADSVAAPAGERENLALRRMLCVAHAGAAAYMDDGEAQDSRDLPVIDFLRDTPAEIQDKLQRRMLKKLAAGAAPTPPTPTAPSVLEIKQ